MQKSKHAFTMIELVFVIVVLGILAAVAVPKFAATRVDAQISKGRSDVAAIRSAIINERQSRLIKGQNSFIPTGTGTYTVNGTTYKQIDNGGLFGGLLTYPITPSTEDGHWSRTASSAATATYVYKLEGADNTFTYTVSDGTFNCTAGTYCSELTQ